MAGFSEIYRRASAAPLRGLLVLLAGVLVTVAVFLARLPGEAAFEQKAIPLDSVQSGHQEGVPDASNVGHAVVATEKALTEAVERDPANGEARLKLARFLQDSHRPDDAVPHYEAYLTSSPEDRQAWLDLTDCLGASGQWEQARQKMLEFLGRWPDDPIGMYNLGAILANTGRLEEAKEWWGRVRDQNQDPQLSEKAAAALAKL